MATKLTIKKSRLAGIAKPATPNANSASAEGDVPEMPVAPAKGGAVINSRLRLDAPDPASQKPMVGRKAAQFALIAGILAMLVSGILTFTLYKHWEFLMPW